jgi:hypothetical protein
VKATSSTPPIVKARHEAERQRCVYPVEDRAFELALAAGAEHQQPERQCRVPAPQQHVRPGCDVQQFRGEAPDGERAGGRGQGGPPPRQPGALGGHRGPLPDVDLRGRRHGRLRLDHRVGLGHGRSLGAPGHAPDSARSHLAQTLTRSRVRIPPSPSAPAIGRLRPRSGACRRARSAGRRPPPRERRRRRRTRRARCGRGRRRPRPPGSRTPRAGRRPWACRPTRS